MVQTVILQDYLDEIGDAVMSGDWDAYRRGVSLPFNLVTQAANIIVDTEAKLREGFDSFYQMLQSQGVSDYIRLVQSANALDPELLSGTYVTHIISHGNRVVPPYTSQITLRAHGNAWQAVSISNALRNDRWPLLVPSPAMGDSKEGGPE